MQQLTFVGAGRLEWQEVSDPTLDGPGQALIRPIAVATCDLDAHIVRGHTPFTPPFGIGHECVGRVVSVGEAVREVQVGEVVAVPFQPSCGTCTFCRRGLTASCTEVPRTSMYGIGAAGGNWGGAFSDLLRVPFADHMLLRLPEDVSPDLAASAGDNMADAWRAVAPPLHDHPRVEVAIFSRAAPGSVALYAAAIAVALGARSVDYFDDDRARLETAERVGARPHEVREWPERLGSWPVTVDATLDPAGLACAIRSTEPWGTCTSTSIFFEAMTPVPMLEMYMKGISFHTGRVPSRTVLPEVVRLIELGRFDPSLITSERAAWSDADEAVGSYTTKLVVTR
jgi:threonine dehydrogenase-like Zn-dependent dehydrogenase